MRLIVFVAAPVCHLPQRERISHKTQCSVLKVRRGVSFERERMTAAIRIGIMGDFEPTYHSHFATNAALYDAATKLKAPLEVRWLPTPSLEGPAAEKILRRWDGLIASPGSPYKSFIGMLRGIEFARTRDWPFVWTGGDFQHTLLKCARIVLKIADSDPGETNSGPCN